jgi:hypothetical protein
MATLETLRDRAVNHLKQASAIIKPLDPALDAYGKDSALSTLESTVKLIKQIDIASYRALRRERASTKLFDDAIEEAKRKTGDENYALSDLNRMLERLARAPNTATIDAVGAAKTHVRRAHRDPQLMTNSVLRVLLSNWLIIGIFIIAIAYALVYYVFIGAGVENPLTSQGAGELATKAKLNWDQIKQGVEEANSVLEAIKSFISNVTNLVSTIPPLVIALGGIWSIVRKIVGG